MNRIKQDDSGFPPHFEAMVGKSILKVSVCGPIRITVDGVEYVPAEKPKPKPKPRDKEAARNRAARKFMSSAGALVGWPLSDDEQRYWRKRVDEMVANILRGSFASKKQQDALLHEICEAVSAATRRAASSTLPWFATTLGLASWPVESAQVKSAYRKLALKRHPNRGGTHEGFVELQRAYSAAYTAIGVAR